MLSSKKAMRVQRKRVISNDDKEVNIYTTRATPFKTLPRPLAQSIARYAGAFNAFSPAHLFNFVKAFPVKYLLVSLLGKPVEEGGINYLNVFGYLAQQGVDAEVFVYGEVATCGAVVRHILQCSFVECLTYQAANIRDDDELALFRDFSSAKNKSHFLELEVNATRNEICSLAEVVQDLTSKDKALKYLDLHGSLFIHGKPFPCKLGLNPTGSFGVMYLRLRGVKLSSTALECLLAELRERKQMKQLDLSMSSIKDVGVCKLARVLRRNTGLLRLELVDVGMTCVGTTALASALRENSTLESLAICYGELGRDGADALGYMVKRNTGLKQIDFTNCHFAGTRYRFVAVEDTVENLSFERFQRFQAAEARREDSCQVFWKHTRYRNRCLLNVNDELFEYAVKLGKIRRPQSKSLSLPRACFGKAYSLHCSYFEDVKMCALPRSSRQSLRQPGAMSRRLRRSPLDLVPSQLELMSSQRASVGPFQYEPLTRIAPNNNLLWF